MYHYWYFKPLKPSLGVNFVTLMSKLSAAVQISNEAWSRAQASPTGSKQHHPARQDREGMAVSEQRTSAEDGNGKLESTGAALSVALGKLPRLGRLPADAALSTDRGFKSVLAYSPSVARPGIIIPKKLIHAPLDRLLYTGQPVYGGNEYA